ncbi:hypothetical protein [Aestuariicoccus sp. MJ-SS9]|uniref:hypothetical protein n=1 Tax=Aestuariicoccus sp. MJ-SS9 TaxID=3079855 RepID=UPI0029094301|nr:hypothetical protein [Aestuariicoccus sp. MJ-SS9]MDU8910510.1 hypothetical protein [Aestuariicoccus sp. MJ-SS9]
MSDFHWVTFLRVCFPDIIAAADRRFPAMPGADIWRFCPTQRLGPEGIPSYASDVWCGMAVFDDEEAARAAFDDPQAHLPFLAEAENVWVALAVPFAHRGAVKWRDAVETDSALRVCRTPPEGTLAVVTSAGFDADSAVPMARRLDFARGVEAVLKGYAEAPGNIFRDVGNGAGVDGRDGLTLSLWDSDAAMVQAAYKPGVHRGQMDGHFGDAMFDRSSFSRFRVQGMRGDWGRAAAAA